MGSSVAARTPGVRVAIGKHIYSLWALSVVAAGISSWAEGKSIEGFLATLVLVFALKGLLMFAIGVFRAGIFSQARERMRLDVFNALSLAKIRSVEAKKFGAPGNLLVHEMDGAGFRMDRICAAPRPSGTRAPRLQRHHAPSCCWSGPA